MLYNYNILPASNDVYTWPAVSQNALNATVATMFLRREQGRKWVSTASSLLLLTFPSATNEIQAVCGIMKSNTHIFLIFFTAIWLVSRLCPLHIKTSELQHCILPGSGQRATWGNPAQGHLNQHHTTSMIILFCFYIKTPMLFLHCGILLYFIFIAKLFVTYQ